MCGQFTLIDSGILLPTYVVTHCKCDGDRVDVQSLLQHPP